MNHHIMVKEGRKTYEVNPETGMKVLVKPAQKYTDALRRRGTPSKIGGTSRVQLRTGRDEIV